MSSEPQPVSEPKKTGPLEANATPLQISLAVGGLGLLLVVLLFMNKSPNTSSYQPSYSTPSVQRNKDSIDEFVDEQVEKNWRPMPGGNSKEDAARVTKDIMHAKTPQELEEVIRKHSREGR